MIIYPAKALVRFGNTVNNIPIRFIYPALRVFYVDGVCRTRTNRFEIESDLIRDVLEIPADIYTKVHDFIEGFNDNENKKDVTINGEERWSYKKLCVFLYVTLRSTHQYRHHYPCRELNDKMRNGIKKIKDDLGIKC